MVVDIIGSGITSNSYDWTRRSYKWGVTSSYRKLGDKIDLYFSMHQDQKIGNQRVPEMTLDTYPLRAIIEKYDSDYFSCSPAYMIAYALFTGAKEINIYGIDMEANSEYNYERPCVAYWMGMAKALGCKVYHASGFGKSTMRYGYNTGALFTILDERIKACTEAMKDCKMEDKAQWLGARTAYEKMVEIIRS